MNHKNESDVRVVMGVPVSDTDAMRALTAQAIGGCIIESDGLFIDMVLRRSCDIASNRTWLVKRAIESGATHILFVDSDMIFPANALKQLLSHAKEIVGVEYHKRQFPLEIIGTPTEERSETELYKAKYAGTGLLLIDLKVFSKIEGAWFLFGRDAEGALVMGEDVYFCNKARDAGFDIWIDPTVKTLHCGEYLY